MTLIRKGILQFISSTLLLSVFILQSACSQNDTKTAGKTEQQSQAIAQIAEEMTAEQFNNKMQELPGQIVDVRTPNEFAQGYITGAINMDLHNPDFKTNLEQLDKSKPVYVYCASGNRSGQAMRIMQQQGFTTIYNYKGTFTDWVAKGYPVSE